MNTPIDIHALSAYNESDLHAMEGLLESLSQRFVGKSISSSLIDEIIASPHHDLLVARNEGIIVGIATLSITIGPGAGRKAYLEDLVISPNHRGKGIGKLMWGALTNWCKEKDVTLFFTSSSKKNRSAARKLYESQGATIKDTSVYEYKPL